MTTLVHIKLDAALKKRAEKTAEASGISLSALVNLSIRQTLNTGTVNLEEPLEFNKKTQKKLDKILKDVRAGRSLSPVFENVEDAIKYLELEK